MEPYNSTDTCDTSESCNDYPFLRDDSGDVCNFDDHQFTDISIPPIANILQLLNDRASRQIRPSKSKLSRLEKSNANRAKYLAAVQYLLVCGNDDIGVITSQATNGDVRIFFTMRDYKSTSDPGKVDIQPDGKLFRACRFLYDNR